VRHLRAIPGVLSAASSLRTPITDYGWNELAQPEGYRSKSRRDTLMWFNRVSPQYFSTMGTRLQMGRDFTDADNLEASKVMVISEGTARHFFGFANPLGKRIGIGLPGNDNKEDFYQVIGVVNDSKYQRIDEDERLTGFFASGQDADPQARINFEVRYAGPAVPSARAVRSTILSINPNVSLEFRDLETQVNESVMQPRIVALLSGIFGLLALALSAVGLYGVTAYGMSRRRNEIGIRIALGARRGSVIWLALRDVGALLAVGLALGLCGSLALGRLVKSLLYGVRANDPRQLAAAAVILALCAFIAAYLPARRAASLDPLDALREE
jgi:putative ABC transport system permease protein